MIKKHPILTIGTSRKICSDTPGYVKKSNEHLNHFIKQGYDSFKLRMVAKDQLKIKIN